MKILVMGFTKIKYMPYMNFYLENMDVKSNEIHLLYWNRDLKEEDTSFLTEITLHEFRCVQEDDVPKFSKLGSFYKYRKFAKRILDKEKFDLIIVLHSLPGVLIWDTLCGKYKNKFIFDYRDSTYEGFAPFKYIIGDLVRNSCATFVSSDAFRRFLPEQEREKIYTSHNMLMDSLSHRDEKKKNGTVSEKIRIAFWGFIRHEEVNREIIRKIASDDRFELHYYGREQQIAWNLKKLVHEIGADNIFFHGEYKPEDRYEFVRNTDIIHNLYKDSNTMLAMGNKYYDSVIFYIPLMSMRGSYMAEIAGRACIGFDADPADDNFTEAIFQAYSKCERKAFEKCCDLELERVLTEYKAGSALIRKLTNSERKE